MRRLILLAAIAALSLSVAAQKETWNWVFGEKAGLTWHYDKLRSMTLTGWDGTLPATLDSLPGSFKTAAEEIPRGGYSVSDKEGNLLFYSNGNTIWNGIGEQIITNLITDFGRGSGAQQPGIAIPYPGSPGKYICLGLSYRNGNKLRYCVVRANSPSDVTVETTPRGLFSGNQGYLGEAMTAIRHANGTDWWIVAPSRLPNNNALNAWLVNREMQASSTPVITPIPANKDFKYDNTGGIKFSPDGKCFAWGFCQCYPGMLIGNFDASTGRFSNIRVVDFENNLWVGDVEFSPSQEYLYAAVSSLLEQYAGIYIWNLQALLDGTTITHRIIPPPRGYRYYGMQLDRFGRIWGAIRYAFNEPGNTLFVIDNPDAKPDEVNIYDTGLDFLVSGTYTTLSLPSFSASFFAVNATFEPTTPCMKDPVTFTATVSVGTGVSKITSLEWNFGDGSPVETDTNISSEYSKPHTYTKPGTYTLTITPYRADGKAVTSRIATQEIKVYPCVMPVNPNVHMYN